MITTILGDIGILVFAITGVLASAPRTAAAGESAQAAPSANKSSALALVRVWSVTG